MTKLHYLHDQNDEQQVFNEIALIAKIGMEDKGYANLTKYIAQALDYLEYIGVPDKKILPFVTENEDGQLLTFATIVKELKYHPPLLEFRVNWRGTGYFRAIFFCVEKNGEQNIYFTKAILKQEPNPPKFTFLATESEKMLKEFNKT